MLRRALPVALLASMVACETPIEPAGGVIHSPVGEPGGNVNAYIGGEFEVNDTAVVVRGQPILRFGDTRRAVLLQRSQRLEFDFVPFPGATRSDVHSVRSSYFDFRHELSHGGPNTQPVGYDHGTVAFDGVPFDLLGGGTHRKLVHADLRYMSGRAVSFDRPAFADKVFDQRPISVTSSGSAAVAPVAASVRSHGGIELVGLASAGTIDLDAPAMPHASANHPLVLRFDRPLLHQRAIIRLIPHHHGPGPHAVAGQTALFQLLGDTDRVVIPADALRQVMQRHSGASASYLLLIAEHHVTPDVVTGTVQGGGRYSLPFIQDNVVSLRFVLER